MIHIQYPFYLFLSPGSRKVTLVIIKNEACNCRSSIVIYYSNDYCACIRSTIIPLKHVGSHRIVSLNIQCFSSIAQTNRLKGLRSYS